jgi:hypothetical protein
MQLAAGGLCASLHAPRRAPPPPPRSPRGTRHRAAPRAPTHASSSAASGAAPPPPPRPAVELLVLDFERGLRAAAGGAALQARGLGAALAYTPLPFYVLTDDAPCAVAAARADAGVELPPGRLFARSLDGLRAVAARPLAADPATRCHLVSGDAALLAAAAAEPRLAHWRLHAAAWPTAAASAPAAAPATTALMPQRAAPLTLDTLVELLNFGLVMGVGDGCQEKFDAEGRELESN